MENLKQRLFEELDRFDDSNAMPDISVSRKNIKIVNTSFSKNMDLEACSSEAPNLDTSRILFTLESIKSDLKKASAIVTNPAHNLQTNETENLVTVKSIISRLEASSTFASYRLTKLDLEEASSTAISSSGDDENTLKSSSSVPGFDSYDSPKSDPEETQDTKTVENSVKSTSNSMRVELDSWNSRFGSYISMRKLKGWKRTFTCKLFEARCSLCGGGEGMESLWEAYEEDTTNKISDVDGDKDDQFMGNGQLCCFKALRMSTGKMNLGMGKPNLVKISKALKGFGWLHHRLAKNVDYSLVLFITSMYYESARTKAQEQQDEPLFEG
ncbi:hypothetical protein Tco_1524070 [Tanacetum coccineum]